MLLSQRKGISCAANSTQAGCLEKPLFRQYLHPRGTWQPTLGSAWCRHSTRIWEHTQPGGQAGTSKGFADRGNGSSLGMLRCLGCPCTLLQRMPVLLSLQTRCSWLKKLRFPGRTRATFKNYCEISTSASV